MKLDSKEALLNDFNKMVSSIDFKNYSSASPEFMNALFIGMMWQILSDLPGMDESYDGFGHDISEELDGAEHYIDCFHKTTDPQYKQMAADELRHAKMLINMHASSNLTPEDNEVLEELEHRRSAIAERLM